MFTGDAIMPRSKKKPAYTLHKPSGRARVRVNGDDIYLGEYGSQESLDRYDELIVAWLANNGEIATFKLTVDDLVVQYLTHARQHYRKNGRLTSEFHCLRSAFRPLVELYGKTRAREFGPRAIKAVREQMVAGGYLRGTVNSMVNRVRRLFRWGVENEFVPVTTYQALCTVQGLQRGRTAAPESDPVRPVEESIVDATIKHLSPVVAAMVQLQ